MNKEVLDAFERDFFVGLEMYSRVREQQLLKEGAEAKDWDGVKRAQGAREELKTLRALHAQYEKHIATRNLATK